MALISSPVTLLGGNITGLIGLSLTQVVDGGVYSIASHIPSATVLIQVIGILADLCLAGIFVLFGVMAGRNHCWAVIAGMAVYGLDALLVLVIQDIPGVIIHLFILVLLFGGRRALRRLPVSTAPHSSTV